MFLLRGGVAHGTAEAVLYFQAVDVDLHLSCHFAGGLQLRSRWGSLGEVLRQGRRQMGDQHRHHPVDSRLFPSKEMRRATRRAAVRRVIFLFSFCGTRYAVLGDANLCQSYFLYIFFNHHFLNSGTVRVEITKAIEGTIALINGFGNFAKKKKITITI